MKCKLSNLKPTQTESTNLKPPFGHEEVIFDALLSELLGHVKAHGAILVIDLPLGLIIQDGVGVVNLLKLLRCLRVVRVLIWVVLQRKLPDTDRRAHRKSNNAT